MLFLTSFIAPPRAQAQQADPFTAQGEQQFRSNLERRRPQEQPQPDTNTQPMRTLGDAPENSQDLEYRDNLFDDDRRFEARGGDERPLIRENPRSRSPLERQQNPSIELQTGDPANRRRAQNSSIERADIDFLEGRDQQQQADDSFEEAFLRAERELNQDADQELEREREDIITREQRAEQQQTGQPRNRRQANRRQRGGRRPQNLRRGAQTAAARQQLAADQTEEQADLNDITGSIRPNAPEEIYAQEGKRIGSFLLFPEVTITTHLSDNPTASPANGPGDEAIELQPRFLLRSDWSRHLLEFEGQLTKSYYDDLTSENIETWFLTARGQLDIENDHFFRLEGRIENNQDERGDVDDLNTDAELASFQNMSLTALYNYQWNRATLQLEGGLSDFDYDDATTAAGLVINNDDQDYLESTARTRLSYTFHPGLYIYGEGRYSTRDYDAARDDQGFQRGSESYAAEIGSIIDITSQLRLETSLGHHWLYADDIRYQDAQQMIYLVSLTYRASEQTTWVASIEQDIDGTDLAGTVGVRETEYSLALTHYFRPHIRLTSSLTFEEEDYIGVDISQETLAAELAFQYIFNRHMRLLASYEFTDVSTNDGGDYQENIFRIGLNLRP